MNFTENIQQTTIPEIIFEDEEILILFKPASWFVHPPENPRHRRGLKRRTCVQWLMDVHNIRANPAHRIDVPTEGVLVFGKSKKTTAHLNLQFSSQAVKKTYHAVVRGWFTNSSGTIELPLELDSTQELVPCRTNYQTLGQIEQAFSVHPKFTTSRYSLLELHPHTGRWHQIRRHMNRVSHPIIGDREHGDSRHSRYFRENLNIEGLCLRASRLQFIHPGTLQEITFNCPQTARWTNIESLFQKKK